MILDKEPLNMQDGELIKDFSEFSGISVEEIVKRVTSHRELNTLDFETSGNIESFYEGSKSYVYDLLSAHWNLTGPYLKVNKFLPGIMETMKNHPGKTFMEFGGGIGDFCQIMEQWANKDVTYVDIESYITDFAIWRKAKYNLHMNMHIIPQHDFELPSTYDIIYHDAVLEHIPEDRQIPYVKKLLTHLNRGGIYVQIIDLAGESDDMPMHFFVDISAVFSAIANSGMKLAQRNGHFASVWIKQ